MTHCMTHPDRPATHCHKSGNDTFLLCQACADYAKATGVPPAKITPFETTTNPRFPPEGERIAAAIQDAFRAEIQDAVKVATEKAKAELDRRVPEIVAGLTLRIMQKISMQRLDNELVIHVRMDHMG